VKKKRTWFAKISCGAGMTKWEKYENMTQAEADDHARLDCIDWAESFGYYQDIDYFGDYDQLGKDGSWDDETEEYGDISELEYYVEYYDPEEHDGYL
tara:strand:- start:8702 stop:8992 length:291 start_codon:yes stop_codon:yes gene_type:complete